VLLFAAPARAVDRVKLATGSQASGAVTEITPNEVTVELGATKRQHPVNVIESITFDDEPNDLTQARFAVAAGRYADAAQLLAKIDLTKIKRPAIAEDVEFYKAIASARAALNGNGSVADAGRTLVAFERAHATSFHYYEVCEALGNLLTLANLPDRALSYYTKLAAAPWPEYKLRAAMLQGRALVGQKKFSEAEAKFDEVLDSSEKSEKVDALKLSATLGKAEAQAGAGNGEQAVAAIEKIIAAAKPEDREVQARAYNVLGTCYRAAGKKQDAVLAFLHVDLLYPQFPAQHAEALANLAALWAEINMADRAAQAQSALKEKYPQSAWAQK
jgi:tetratricopeptide (TPR) repeat protein